MNGKKPNKEEKRWLDQIIDQGCIVCYLEKGIYSPAEVHHISGKDEHLETIPLCFPHHREGGNNTEYVSRHPWRKEFIKRYGSEGDLLFETKMRMEG